MSPDHPLSVALVSLGCPKNLIDSEKMLAQLAEAGLLVGAPLDDADVIVVNTCGFIAAARAESLGVIHEALEQKRIGRARRVIVAGCLVNRDAKDLYEAAPGIDAIVGVNDRGRLLSAVTGRREGTMLRRRPGPIRSDAGRFRLTPRHIAYLRISEGCSQQCTFCTIPAIRGPLRSKTPETVLAEAEELIADGVLELNIIGQDTTSYGRDLPARGATLAALLKKLDRLDGAAWIRLLYAYPRRFTDALIEAIAGARHVVPYLDLPLQHISDPILHRMGRGVTRKSTEKLLQKLRDRIQDVAIRTTFIVGFPGETDADSQELLEFVEDFGFDALGVFEFSPEPGTPAAQMPGAVPAEVAAERAKAIMLAQQEIAFSANARAVGKKTVVLVDGVDPQGRCFGRRASQAPDIDSVCYLTEPASAGVFVSGHVVAWSDYDLIVESE